MKSVHTYVNLTRKELEMNPVKYKPFSERTPDTQYRNLLKRILEEGVEEPTPQGFSALTVFGHQMRFNLSNGFPIITERDVFEGTFSVFNQVIGELMAFLNGVRTQEGLESYGCKWWKKWTSKEYMERTGLPMEPGDLGPGSYPGGWTAFPKPDGSSYNQIKAVLQQMKELPYLRRHFVTPWIPYYIHRHEGGEPQVVVAPCHGWFHIRIYTSLNKLSLHHFQRSADVPVGLASNLIQYAALTLMFAQVLGYEAWELVYTTSDTHMYISDDPEKDQRPAVEKMLNTKPQPFPEVILDDRILDLFAFRQSNFTALNYKPQLERMRIWTPV